jgi:hypothetical protein
MGLYLCVFDGENELDGVEVGSYADYGGFLETITEKLEGGIAGSRFPTLVLHSDCDGEWHPSQVALLEVELRTIADEMHRLAPVSHFDGWKADVARQFGLNPTNLCDSFFDIDGEPLIERLLGLCKVARDADQPIIFQ